MRTLWTLAIVTLCAAACTSRARDEEQPDDRGDAGRSGTVPTAGSDGGTVELASDASDVGTISLPRSELTSRLAATLWPGRSVEEVSAAIDFSTVHTREDVRTVTKRMLDDDRALQGIRVFAKRWLLLDVPLRVDSPATPWQSASPELRAGVDEETSRFLHEIVRSTGSSGTLEAALTAPFSMIDATLAAHYGAQDFHGTSYARWEPSDARSGLLTQAGFLMRSAGSFRANSNAPVRGHRILRTFACMDPIGMTQGTLPPPPANPATFRSFFEEYTAPSPCSNCHRMLNPLGFALEAFDSLGHHRTEDRGHSVAIDADLAGPADIRGHVVGAGDLGRQLARATVVRACLVRRVLEHVSGREVTDDEVAAVPQPTELSLRELFADVVASDAFLGR